MCAKSKIISNPRDDHKSFENLDSDNATSFLLQRLRRRHDCGKGELMFVFDCRHVHSVHHQFRKVNVWVSQYDHPWELICLGIAGTVAPAIIGAHPLTTWSFMMLNDWVGADSHGGYDLPGLPHRWVPFWGGPIKHAMHHQRPLTNFQPYFNYIDRLMGTECPGLWAGGLRTPALEEWERNNLRKYSVEEKKLK
jgi:sterol desaturase/sphingolipid hydroxylase (fatty acid hydroxylase superfamily)